MEVNGVCFVGLAFSNTDVNISEAASVSLNKSGLDLKRISEQFNNKCTGFTKIHWP